MLKTLLQLGSGIILLGLGASVVMVVLLALSAITGVYGSAR